MAQSEVKCSDVAQSCLTLCDPVDCSLQGSSVHGIFQARVLEWVAISFSRGSSRPRSPALRADTLPSEPLGKNHILVETPNFLIHLSTPHTHLIALLTLHLHLNNCVWLEKNQWPGRLELYIKQIHHHIRRRQWHLTPVLLPGKSHGRRSLVGCGPRGR